MPLTAGTRLGPYEIVAPIGAGGMGEVYQGRDTRLDRTVAVKISAEQFSERFEREARAVAALNHPNICTLHDVGPNYLVMEYIEGPTLAERIAAGPIPLAEALPIARQIAEALEAAHEKGIVHRDLKPGNVKVKPDGQVKVLDFGLAKAFEGEAASSDPANSPTLSLAATRAGMILGTAAYMSPEQARGVAVDKRADIWAYGVVLFEMLTGRQAFAGETISDTLAAVLRADLDWSAPPPDTPAPIRRLLRRCLARDRKNRLPDIAVARLEIEEALSAPAQAPALPLHKPALLPWAAATLLLLASTAWLALALWRTPPPDPGVQFTLPPPEKGVFPPVLGGEAISPDGRTLGFVATQGKTLLWVRRLDSLAARPLPGTEEAHYPFWSPDNRFLGFFADGKLKKIEVAGGPPQVLCDAGLGRGGTWSPEGIIVFGGTDSTLQRVPEAGGQPAPVSQTNPDEPAGIHSWPSFLPDGRHFLYLEASVGMRERSAICVGSLDGKPAPGNRIVRTPSNGVYAPAPPRGMWPGRAGWLLYLRENALVAQPFDPRGLRLEGEAVPVAERVGLTNTSFANFSVSERVLVYGQPGSRTSRLVWAGRDGRPSPLNTEPASYFMPRLSPDGSKLAVAVGELGTGNTDIWRIDLLRGVPVRFTFDPAPDLFPVWSPDGQKIAFGSSREGAPKIYLKAANGAGNEESITPQSTQGMAGYGQAVYDWSRDGRYILYLQVGAATGPDLWILDLKERKAAPFLQTPFNESQGQFSPDGRWVAYSSNESGRYEISVRSFMGTAARFQVSNDGGAQPRWRGDGKELYYVAPDGKMMAVATKTGAEAFEREAPQMLFQAPSLAGIAGSGPEGYVYDVTRDGQRFLIVERDEGGAPPLTAVTNWQAGLRK